VTSIPNVALLIETSREYGRGLLRGVIRYQHEHGPWSFEFRTQGLDAAPPKWLDNWHGDGILARINDPAMAEAVLRRGVPTVDLRHALPELGLPVIATDNAAVVRLATEHFLDRGLRQFAFFGAPIGQNVWIDYRRNAFAECVRKAGCSCDIFEADGGWQHEGLEAYEERIMAWVKSLPKPVGIMASHDDEGQQLLDACLRAEINVPDEVAVLGVDNDEILCALSRPPLSSIAPNTERIGYEAARLLAGLMKGEPAPREAISIPPLGVVSRQSTDTLALEDREVASALRYIRDNAGRRLTVEDLLRVVPLSRSMFERRMRQAIGRTPKEEILRVELERVKDYLARTNLSLAEIGATVGYTHPHHLCELFKKKFDITPGDYRRSIQGWG
jgi:LacI family transcriptional regulator